MSQAFKHTIIACHPIEESFTLSMARRYAAAARAHGHEVLVRDLYRTGFNPVLTAEERQGQPADDVIRELGHLGKSDVFVLVYPIWFGSPPAMLKGYIDRVFGAGRMRGAGPQGGVSEPLTGKRLVSLTCSGSSRAWLNEKGVLGSLRTIFDRYLLEVFGLTETHRYHFDGIAENLPKQEIEIHLHDVEKGAREVMARMIGGPPDRNPNRN